MPALPIAKGRCVRRDNTPIRLVNAYFEQDPTNVRDQVSMIGRPGLLPFVTLGSGPVVGMIRREDDDDTLLCVGGTSVYALSPSGTVSAAGVDVLGTGRVRMATDGVNTMIVRAGVLYLQAGTGVTAVEMPDDIGVIDVVFLAGRFWIATELDGRVYFTVPGETTVDALNYFSAESAPDPLVGLAVAGDELVLLSRSSVEYWQPTGDQYLPAQRSIGRASKVGCASVHSIALGDTTAWVGDDCMPYRSGDALPVPIGDPGMVEIIRRARAALDPDDPTKTLGAWSFAKDGHSFYVLDVPGFGTHAYDFTTGQWCEFASLGRDLFNACCGAKISDGRWVVGSTYEARVRLFAPEALDDDGSPLVRIYPALLPVDSSSRCDNLIMKCSVGTASLDYPSDNPKVAARVSRDDGKTWSDWNYASLGQQGSYNRKPVFKGIGRMSPPSQLFEFRFSDPLQFTLHGVRYNEPVR